jgi:hypothetical protein
MINFSSLISNTVEPAVGYLVSSAYGYGIIKEINPDSLLAKVAYPKHSLGFTHNQSDSVQVCVANVTTTAIPENLQESLKGILPSIVTRGAYSEVALKQTVAADVALSDLLDDEKIQELVATSLRHVLKQLSEKLDAVRDVAGKVFERFLHCHDPCIGYVIDRKRLVSALERNLEEIQAMEAMKGKRN